MAGALDGLRVIDFGQYVAGPLAAMLLADNGADVVRVDPPGGPRWNSPANAVLQRGKKSIVLDLKQAADVATARQLLASADVAIENFRPGVMDRLGLGAEAMTAANPRLVYCSIPGFSKDDARAGLAGWEGVVSASAGIYFPNINGRTDPDPVYFAMPFASSYAAFIAAHSIVAALIARERAGLGQRIEASLFDAVLQILGSSQFQDGKPFHNFTVPTTKSEIRLIKRHLCADGRWVDISPPWRGVDFWVDRFMPKEFMDSGITHDKSPEATAEVARVLAEIFLQHTAAEWEQICQDIGTGIAPCLTTDEWLHDRHALDSRCAITLNDPELGDTYQAGYPMTLSKTPPQASPRHELDADREAVLEAAKSAASAAGRPEGSRTLSRALEGIHVVDASQILAGPTAGRVLAEYGADVVKINNPRTEENTAGIMAHTYVNNGKRTIMLDLKSADGQEVLSRLIENADVFHQNFALGTVERLGISEAVLRERQPGIIYSAVNTHAPGGFRSGFRGHEELGQAITGMEVIIGGDEEPARAGWPVCDYATGHISALGILLSLYHRMRTGEGQHVRASLSQSGTYLQMPFMVSFEGQVRDIPSGLSAKGAGPLYRLYQASDGWFFLAARQDGDLKRLASVEGLAGVDATPAEQLTATLSQRFATAKAEEWVTRLNAAGLSAQVARHLAEVIFDATVEDRGSVIVRDHPGIGLIRSVGTSARLSMTPLDPLAPAPPVGSHGREVIEQVGLGDRFEELLRNGTVAVPEPATA